MTEDEPAIGAARLEGWEPAVASSGFADRVVAAWQAERTHAPPRRRKRWLPAVGTIAVAVAVAGVVWWPWPSPSVAGELVAAERTQIDLGDRGVAVAETGATLHWSVDGRGRAAIDQPSGSVFYRVQPGPAFEVTTPQGAVRVTGTSFSVEVMDVMDRSALEGLVAGAAISTAVVVTVYEGAVVFADDGRSVEVSAGESALSGAGEGPRRIDDASEVGDELAALAKRSPEALVTRVRLQAREIERLRARSQEQQAEIDRLRTSGAADGTGDETEQARVQRCVQGDRGEPGCSFFDPDDEVLAEMARCSMVKVDIPAFVEGHAIPERITGDWATRAGLTDEESEALARAAEAFREDYLERMRAVYLDAGGLPDVVEDVDGRGLQSLTEALFAPEELGQARRRLAWERAGMADPPAELTLADRYVRTHANVGHDFEAAVAAVIGADRARALRAVDDGWPGGTSVYSGRCEDR